MTNRLTDGLNDRHFNDFYMVAAFGDPYTQSRFCMSTKRQTRLFIANNLFNARQGSGSYRVGIIAVVYIQSFELMSSLSCYMLPLRIFQDRPSL